MFSVFGTTYVLNSIVEIKNMWNFANLDAWQFYQPIYTSYWSALSSTALNTQIFLTDSTSLLSLNALFVYQSITNNLFVMGLFFLFIVYLVTQGLQLISFALNGADIFSDIYGFLSDIDDEIGSIDDTVVYGLIFAVVIGWYFFFTLFVTYYTNNITWFIVLLNFVFLTAVLLPFFVLYSFGISFPVYVRGAGKSNILSIEAFLDIIAIGVMFSRFLIQNFRLILVFAAFFELSEFIYINCDFTGSSIFSKIFNSGVFFEDHNNLYWYDWVGDFIVSQLLLIYYWGHLTIVFITQLINYFLLSFYLFYFLYTTFVLESHEKYFFYKRTLL